MWDMNSFGASVRAAFGNAPSHCHLDLRDRSAPNSRERALTTHLHPLGLSQHLSAPPAATARDVSHGERWQGSGTVRNPPARTPDPSRSRPLGILWLGILRSYQTACLVVLLAIVSTIPIFQLYTLGLLLDASARRSRGYRWGLSLQWLESAGTIISAAFALFLFSLPIRLLVHWAHAAELIDPASSSGASLRGGALMLLVASFVYLGWAWVRGGRLRHYAWPAPLRFVREGIRPATWRGAPDRVWHQFAGLEPGRLFWLGLRCALATLLWLAVPAAMLIGASRNGQTGLAGLVGLAGALLMGWVVIYLPFLQTEFAIDGRFRTMFRIGRVRQLFRRRPLLFLLALSGSLLFAVPLYLLKIEATPREVVWLPAILFVMLILPSRLFSGWVIAKARSTADRSTWYCIVARWFARLAIVPLVLVYLAIVYVSQFTAWEGLSTWFSQHAFLVPVPFAGI